MKKLISFALLGAFLAVSSIGCGDDKASKKTEPPKREVPKEGGGTTPPK
jgi:hypothetical protein